MSTPLLLTSVALLAGVAARPVNPDRPSDALHDLVRSPDKDVRQAFLGAMPSGFHSSNALQLDDLHANTHPESSDVFYDSSSSTSPKLASTDSPSDPDPGLASPYMGPQQHLAGINHRPGAPLLAFDAPSPSLPPPCQTAQPPLAPEATDYSPKVVILVFASLAALVLLGLTVAVLHASQLFRSVFLRREVWKHLTGGRGGEKGDIHWSEKGKVARSEKPSILGRELQVAVQPGTPHMTDLVAAKPPENLAEDPDVIPLPENSPAPGMIPAPYHRDRNREMGLAFVGWTYDNWLMHFMMALFGWLGALFGNARD